mmetsp:Transcript_42711/g.65583  ORF Transcript_42711/g.65583 Transcript_42711/m.65583 type:complete len:110 (-) Transcript_42711:1265-1594(-)
MGPFYPLKAQEKGISVSWVGLVIGWMAIMQVISGIIVGKFLDKLGGRNIVIMAGSLMIIAQIAILAYLNFEDNSRAFLILSFVAQTLGGFGAGANSTASMATLSSNFSN